MLQVSRYNIISALTEHNGNIIIRAEEKAIFIAILFLCDLCKCFSSALELYVHRKSM